MARLWMKILKDHWMKRIAEKYGFTPNAEQIGKSIELLSSRIGQISSGEVLLKCFSLMDLTTLHTDDTAQSVRKLVDKVNRLSSEYPTYPAPASICVYPNFAPVVASCRNNPDVHVTVVSGCFPSSQSFLDVKVKECEMAVAAGAEEVDIVLALNSFLGEDYDAAAAEILAIREACKDVILKVILETGLLVTPERIADASFLAMECGADFIKTSTGKVSVNATPMAAYVMCQCIERYYERTGKKVGFKAAGGISSAADAVGYYSIVSSVLGDGWMNKGLFRLGVSRLGNALMSEIEGRTVNFF